MLYASSGQHRPMMNSCRWFITLSSNHCSVCYVLIFISICYQVTIPAVHILHTLHTYSPAPPNDS